MSSLCKYRDLFGTPMTGAHSYRFMDASIIDYVLTLLLAFLFSKLTKIPLVISTIIMFIIGILLHLVFCVETSSTVFVRHLFS